jgi:hypothetical protein
MDTDQEQLPSLDLADGIYAWPLAVDLGNTLVHTAGELGILLGDRRQREPLPHPIRIRSQPRLGTL